MTIDAVVEKSKCPFAKLAKLSDLLVFKSLDMYAEVKSHKNLIANFFDTQQQTQLDALCIAFTAPSFGETIENLTINTKNFFDALQDEFGTFEYPKSEADYDVVMWPTLGQERFFMVAFAACYPKESPRYNHGDPTTYFLLQPVSSFERQAKDGATITDELRQKIRNLFAANNQPYDGVKAALKNEVVKMVAPLKPNDPIIEWWKV